VKAVTGENITRRPRGEQVHAYLAGSRERGPYGLISGTAHPVCGSKGMTLARFQLGVQEKRNRTRVAKPVSTRGWDGLQSLRQLNFQKRCLPVGRISAYVVVVVVVRDEHRYSAVTLNLNSRCAAGE
jgi:hypothetical protein